MNNSTNMQAMVLPLSALGSYTQRPTPMARDSRRERSFSRMVRSCPYTLAPVAEV